MSLPKSASSNKSSMKSSARGVISDHSKYLPNYVHYLKKRILLLHEQLHIFVFLWYFKYSGAKRIDLLRSFCCCFALEFLGWWQVWKWVILLLLSSLTRSLAIFMQSSTCLEIQAKNYSVKLSRSRLQLSRRREESFDGWSFYAQWAKIEPKVNFMSD